MVTTVQDIAMIEYKLTMATSNNPVSLETSGICGGREGGRVNEKRYNMHDVHRTIKFLAWKKRGVLTLFSHNKISAFISTSCHTQVLCMGLGADSRATGGQ